MLLHFTREAFFCPHRVRAGPPVPGSGPCGCRHFWRAPVPHVGVPYVAWSVLYTPCVKRRAHESVAAPVAPLRHESALRHRVVPPVLPAGLDADLPALPADRRAAPRHARPPSRPAAVSALIEIALMTVLHVRPAEDGGPGDFPSTPRSWSSPTSSTCCSARSPLPTSTQVALWLRKHRRSSVLGVPRRCSAETGTWFLSGHRAESLTAAGAPAGHRAVVRRLRRRAVPARDRLATSAPRQPPGPRLGSAPTARSASSSSTR